MSALTSSAVTVKSPGALDCCFSSTAAWGEAPAASEVKGDLSAAGHKAGTPAGAALTACNSSRRLRTSFSSSAIRCIKTAASTWASGAWLLVSPDPRCTGESIGSASASPVCTAVMPVPEAAPLSFVLAGELRLCPKARGAASKQMTTTAKTVIKFAFLMGVTSSDKNRSLWNGPILRSGLRAIQGGQESIAA